MKVQSRTFALHNRDVGTVALKYFNVVNGISAGEITLNAANSTVVANAFVGNVDATEITATGNVNLGNVSNLSIAGGTSGQVLTTDGAGNLSFTNASAGGGNIFVYTRSSGTIDVPIILGTLNIVGRTGIIPVYVQ